MNVRVGDPFSGHEAVSVTSLIIPVVLCGGGGSRLWPLSHGTQPKQFQSLVEDASPFQTTLARLTASQFRPGIVVTSAKYETLVRKQMREAGYDASSVFLEPERKNSAPAILASAWTALQDDPEAILFVTPSDHLVRDQDVLDQAITIAMSDVREGRIVTFGITPTRAATEYGWIEPENQFLITSPVARFVEKPKIEVASKLLEGGHWLWNSGIFLMKAQTILDEARRYDPDLYDGVIAACRAGAKDSDTIRPGVAEWHDLQDQQIDKAIMELSRKLSVVKVAAGWDDLGDWNAVWRESARDAAGVSVTGDAVAIGCKDSLLRSEGMGSPRLVGIGLNDMVAVATPDAVLVVPRARSQDVRLATLQPAKAAEADPHVVHKPWGSFEVLDHGPHYQVKRLDVAPGGRLSLQSHRHRSEVWSVARGTALVTAGNEVMTLRRGESITIGRGVVHRLENATTEPLSIIEVQSGAYLGEDDITRHEDIYGRA